MTLRQFPGLALLALIATACFGSAWSGSASPASSPVIPGVVIRIHNGSVVQPAVLLDAVEMETKLGKISIPAGEVRRIDFGFRLSEEDAKKLDQALRDLGSEKFQAREAARKTLIAMGRLAYPALVDIAKGADLESARRTEGILKELRARVPAERLQTRRTDVVRTSDSVVTGRITSTELRVRCDLFGEVKLPVLQLREVRSLLPGSDLTVAVDAGKYGNKSSWMETEFEVTLGTRLEITATGEIDLDPGNTLGNNVTRGIRPEGTRQLTSGEGFVPGQIVGRIGSDGPTFVIGPRYSGSPEREAKLDLRIVTIEHANNIRAAGSYQVRISAEPN
jgi:hypothetical protein